MFSVCYLKQSFCLSSVNIDIIKVLSCLTVICLFIPYRVAHSEMYNFRTVKVI